MPIQPIGGPVFPPPALYRASADPANRAADYEAAAEWEHVGAPASPLTRPLTPQEELRQINELGWTGGRNEHLGILVVFAQYAAKAMTLAAAMPAVWLSPDYASLAEYKRVLRDGGLFAGGVNLLNLYAFPMPSDPFPLPPPLPGAQMDLLV